VTHTRAQRLAAAALLFAALLAVLATTQGAHANGVPTMVKLSYIDLSNWGPEDASGEAELIFAEGIVRVEAQGLPRLTTQRYQGWLVNSEVGDAISIGVFNADEVGKVSFQGALPPIADFGFDLVILTVEPFPDDAPQPSGDRSIGGYFSLIAAPGEDGSNEAGQTSPGQLPNTGLDLAAGDMARVALLAGVMALSIFAGIRLGRRSA
jgi:hypothetical protein